MGNRYRIFFATLRRAFLFSLAAGIFVLLSFFTVRSEPGYLTGGIAVRQSDKTTALSKGGDSVKTVLKTPASSPENNIKYDISNNSSMRITMDKGSMTQDELDKGLESLSQAIKELDKLAVENESSVREAGVKKVLSLLQINMNGNGIDQLTFSDEFKSFLTPGNLRKSADNFSAIKKEIEKLNTQKSGQDNMICLQTLGLSVIQDKLIENALTELMKNVMPQMDISKLINSTNFKNISAGLINANPQITSIVQRKDDDNNPQKSRDKKLLAEALRLNPGQIRFCELPFSNQTRLVSIERGRKETKVTLAIPIRTDSNWFLFDKGFTIIDKKTNDRYIVRGLERDLPLDKLIVLEGHRGKMFEATLIFPPLKKSVTVVDIIEFASADAVRPSNSTTWSFKSIYIDDYSSGKPKKSKEYR